MIKEKEIEISNDNHCNKNLQMSSFKIYYHSGSLKYKNNKRIAKLENMYVLKSKSYEYRLPDEISLNSHYNTLPCMYSAKHFNFAGWYMRTEKKKLVCWFCNDLKFHSEIEMYYDKGLEKMLFQNEFNLDNYNFKQNDFGETIVLEAVWER